MSFGLDMLEAFPHPPSILNDAVEALRLFHAGSQTKVKKEVSFMFTGLLLKGSVDYQSGSNLGLKYASSWPSRIWVQLCQLNLYWYICACVNATIQMY